MLREESYTSRASLLDLDAIPAYKKGDTTNHTFREEAHRGIYKQTRVFSSMPISMEQGTSCVKNIHMLMMDRTKPFL